MDLVTKYIMTHSDGRSHPICGSAILSILGYERIETIYTDYGAPVDAPQNLFNNGN